MEEESSLELLQRYRRDRRILLDFILSGSLIKKVVMPPGAVTLDDVDLDQVSVDFVLNCAKKGGMLELAEAIRDYHDSIGLPQMNNTGSVGEFFLVTDPEVSGSPPKRAPPPLPDFTPPPVYTPPPILSPTSDLTPIADVASLPAVSNVSKSESFNSTQVQELTVDDIEDFDDDDDIEEVNNIRMSRRNRNDATDIAVKLPSFVTGITDDDLRETAYEILLACAGASGGLIVPAKEKKKDKRYKIMRTLGRSRTESIVSQSQRAPGLVGLLETMRVQMEISEAMDIRTRQGLLNALSGKVGKRMDALLVPLELLCCISRSEFSDKKAYIRWQKRQLNILEEGLINHPVVGFGESGRKANELRILLAKIEESEFLPSSTGELQRTECLRALRESAIPLAERPSRGDLTGEVCHWADGFHLNVRLYEKLLLSVFDVLDEGKLTEEVEEMLELFKSTWRVLGITETIHCTCYAWVLFRQYVITSDQGILQHAIEQLKRIPLKEQRGPQERLHLKSLRTKIEGEMGSQDVTFLHSFLSPIKKWADKHLGDYHLHFAEDSVMMENIVAVAMISRRLLVEEPEIAVTQSTSDRDQIESYISSSIKNAFARILQVADKLDTRHEHPLALLAEESKKLMEKDSTMFMPILSQRHPQATFVSASLLHRLYGNKLKPFLDGAEHLTEDVVSVFPAADSLEQYIIALITSACEEETAAVLCKRLSLYQIESVSGTLVLRWVNSQLGRILGWVERAIAQERWDPISPQQRHGSSIVEVYRIVEETVDQFFALKVPMRSSELSSLFRGIDNAFQVYANHVVDKLASKEDLIPPVPILTRYRKDSGIKAFVKKELFDPRLPDERKSIEINVLTTPTLCIQSNTLYYAISQLNKLEDSIWERWTRKKPSEKFVKKSIDGKSKSFAQNGTFDGSRKDINAAIDRICEFTGTKIVFWDLREPFINNLYKPSVSQSRFEAVIEPLDTELSQLCNMIVEPLRDHIVTSLLQAALDGLLRVLLDGGPLRLFSKGDEKLLEEDLEVLKEFFISGGDGLPRGVVENQVARVRHVVKLHGYEELVGALLGCSFFCLFPLATRGDKHLPTINFDHLFASLYGSHNQNQESKINCIIHYFERICANIPMGSVSFERKVLALGHRPLCISYPDAKFWGTSTVPLCQFEAHSSGLIEDQSKGALEVDFANKYLGGGALHRGCVQEEIRFMVNPELIAGMLFLPALADNESIEVVGAERFSKYTGYASSFRFSGDYVDKKEMDSLGRRKTRIIAIDALCCPGMRQYRMKSLIRETNKAFCGFIDQSKYHQYERLFLKNGLSENQHDQDGKDPDCTKWNSQGVNEANSPLVEAYGGEFVSRAMKDSQQKGCQSLVNEDNMGIATGNWGCGAFGGDPELKTIIQWLAASQALRPFVSYYTFGERALRNIDLVTEWILSHEWTVGDLWNMLVEYSSQILNGETNVGFFTWLIPTLPSRDS